MHRTMSGVAMAAALCALLPSCAGIGLLAGRDRADKPTTIAIESDPPGAACEIKRDGALVARVAATPASAEIPKGTAPLAVRCERDEYLPTTERVEARLTWSSVGRAAGGGPIGAIRAVADGRHEGYPARIAILLEPSPTAAPAARAAYFARLRETMERDTDEEIGHLRDLCSRPREFCEDDVARAEALRAAALSAIEARRQSAQVAPTR